jgi:hypothetical protein
MDERRGSLIFTDGLDDSQAGQNGRAVLCSNWAKAAFRAAWDAAE